MNIKRLTVATQSQIWTECIEICEDILDQVLPGNSSVSEHSDCSFSTKPQIDFSPNASFEADWKLRSEKTGCVRCSFCERPADDVQCLISVTGLNVCDDCVDLFQEFIASENIEVPAASVWGCSPITLFA
jgi:hypothetical protein